jgi:hypothetical protein
VNNLNNRKWKFTQAGKWTGEHHVKQSKSGSEWQRLYVFSYAGDRANTTTSIIIYTYIWYIYIYIEHMYIGVYIHRTYFQKSEINERGWNVTG